MKIFGFEIKSANKEDSSVERAKVAPPQPDGSWDVEVGNSYFYDFDVAIKQDKEIIEAYRQISRLADVDDAVDEIVNECIVVQDQNQIVEVMLEKTEFSDPIKKKIYKEFEYLLGLLNFHDCGDQIFRQWYVDGRHYYHKVVKSDKLKEGIQELNWLDPCKTKKVREFERDEKGNETSKIVREYFLYDPTITRENDGGMSGMSFSVSPIQTVVELMPESVAYTTSGIMDFRAGKVLSYLHKAIKPANQLSLLEDSMVVYRLTRAPERRIFYIDIGNLGASRAEQYVRNIMTKYKNRLVYDVETGSVEASKAHLSMMEDIWLPRKEGGRGTEVSTLPAGANLGDIEDVLYFKRRLVKALKIPVSRMDAEGALFSIGVSGEVTRDELKFNKYVDKVRRRFNTFFYDLLKTQLLLKGIITSEEWDRERSRIGFIYNRDSYISELQKAEMWRQRFDLMSLANEHVGQDMYLSQRWVRENILKQTDEERLQIEKDWKSEPQVEIDGEGGEEDFGAPGVEGGTPASLPPARPAAVGG